MKLSDSHYTTYRGEMAHQGIQHRQEKLSCSICLDLLKVPVTIPCGHNYCMSCIQNYWDSDNSQTTHSCPQCRKDFTPRPALVKNTMLADLVEDLKKLGLQAASSDLAGPEDVACDLCTGRKAIKSCLVCLASYCGQHLQPHYDIAPLKKHKLVEATSKLQENICPHHDEVMKIFCRTDQQCICYLCSMDEHKGHDMVSTAAERAVKQTELGVRQQIIQQGIQHIEKEVKVLQEKVEAINCSADKAVKDSEEIFTGLITVIKKKSLEVNQQIRSQQETDVTLVKELEKKLQQEISELKKKGMELEQISHTEDHLNFLANYSSLSHPSPSTDLPSVNLQSQKYFEEAIAALSKPREKLLAVLNEDWGKSSEKITGEEISPQQQPEPKTRNEFLKWARQITLDPVTANVFLLLSKNNRKATLMGEEQQQVFWIYPQPFSVNLVHPEQFVKWWQVLSLDGLTGRCYWEVKWRGKVLIAVAYRDISRTGNRRDCGFGNNVKSWALECCDDGYTFRHNNVSTPVTGPHSARIGVYLDHTAGTLSFYSISGTWTLLFRVQTRFTQPVYPGFWFPDTAGDNAEFCEL
ncbi:tripartite motif-containing protein 16-like [Channa argus]|uniref:tripartite motif-containing protein 16-like n=1 Tax=Channa argus TaxID=215402 RepID=UPI0035213A4F